MSIGTNQKLMKGSFVVGELPTFPRHKEKLMIPILHMRISGFHVNSVANALTKAALIPATLPHSMDKKEYTGAQVWILNLKGFKGLPPATL